MSVLAISKKGLHAKAIRLSNVHQWSFLLLDETTHTKPSDNVKFVTFAILTPVSSLAVIWYQLFVPMSKGMGDSFSSVS